MHFSQNWTLCKQTQDIDLGLTREEMHETRHAVLTIETDKSYRGGVESDARVMWHGRNSRSCAMGIGGGGDFSKKILLTPKQAVTQKKIDKQHAQVFTPEVVEALKAEALEYYASGLDKR